ncbi:MAG: hypothetical protein ACYC5O_17735 [Anaerolineae bacterium]
MDELVKMVTQKAGITEAQAKSAIETVMGFIKDKLPAPIAAQVNGLLGTGKAGDAAGGLGGLFGGR